MALKTDRWYCSLNVLKAELGETGTTNDTRLKRYLGQASRQIEDYTGRTFIPVTETRYFDVPQNGAKLFLQDDDLLTLTTLTDQTGTITSIYYWLYPLNLYPKHTILLDTSSLGRGFEYDDEPNRAISIVGQWGYTADYVSSGAALGAAISSTSVTTITTTVALETGWTLLIDSEALFVSAVNGLTATVQRGANGTTAATHLITATVYRYAPPEDIELACIELAAHINNTRTAGNVRSMSIGEYSVSYGTEDMPATVMATLNRYRRLV